jgi:hypothetical protein
MGETVETAEEATKYLRQKIYRSMEEHGYRDLIDSMIETFELCNKLADPMYISEAPRTTTAKSDEAGDVEDLVDAAVMKLERSLISTKNGFAIAISTATKDVQKSASMPVFAHVARRLTSFHSLCMLGQNLIQYYENNIASQQEGTHDENCKNVECRGKVVMSRCFASVVHAFKTPWLWHDAERRRLALKTSVGMFFASLFISVGVLWEISKVSNT